MTAGSAELSPAESETRAPVLVLGLGNLLLQDDGVGLRLLELVAAQEWNEAAVEFVDGGTQGLALLGYLPGRKLTLVLDAVGLGDPPGTVHHLRGPDLEKLRAHRSTSAHEGNALELLATAQLLGDEPEELIVIGIEPDHVRTGVGLSDSVTAALPEAVALACRVIRSQSNRQEGPCV